MRGTVEDQPLAKPVIEHLPGIYQADVFTGQFLSGFDDIIAPIITELDCLDAYVDPLLTPHDFLDWLAGWVGLAISEDWSVDQQRLLLLQAVDIFSRRGTLEGLRREVELYTGADVTVEVEDSGGTLVSQRPGAELPGRPTLAVRVVVTQNGGAGIDRNGLESLVRSVVPAHLYVETVQE